MLILSIKNNRDRDRGFLELLTHNSSSNSIFFMQYLLYLLGFYLLILLIQYITVFLRLKKSTVQYPQYSIVPHREIPFHFQTTLASAIAQLEALGFQKITYLKTKPTYKLWSLDNWSAVLVDAENTTCVIVEINFFSEPINLFKYSFYSFLNDDTILLTMNAEKHGVMSEMPQFVMEDEYVENLATQWQNHQAKLVELTKQNNRVRKLELLEFLAEITASGQQYVDYLALKRIIVPQEDNSFGLSMTTTIKTTHNLVRGSKKVNRMLAKKRDIAKNNPDLTPKILPEIEVEAFNRMEEMNEGLISKKNRWRLLFISLFVSALILAFSQWFAGWNLIIFLGVLAFHEMGHALAMKVFGYRDTSVLFIPFFGALAIGKKDDATFTQKFWVFLAGPLPGLIVGIILAFMSQGKSASWLHDTSVFFIALNMFNLLPIYPLDGGQIAELLIFSGMPYLGVTFRILGVAILGILGLTSQSPFLLFFALLIALSIPTSFRSTKINIKLRSQLQQNPQQDRQDILLTIYRSLNSLENQKPPFGKRYALAKNLLMRHREKTAPWTTKLFLSFTYLITLLAGIFFSTIAFFSAARAELSRSQEFREQNPQIVHQEISQKIAFIDEKINQDPHNIEHRYLRARLLTKIEDYPSAIAEYQHILILNPQDTLTLSSRAEIYVKISQYDLAIDDYTEIIAIKPNSDQAYIERGNIQLQLKNYPAALEDANRAISLNSKSSEGYLLRSQAKEFLNEMK